MQSRSLGLQLNFQNIDELSCLSLANAEDIGACVMSGDYENLCSYGKRSACSGIFYKDKSCTDSSLDTICKPTEKTKCFGDSVYLIDSCGNQADLYQQCDYAQGTKCGKYRPGIDTRPDKGDYVCQDLNCEDGAGNARNNGERWCAGDVSSSFGGTAAAGQGSGGISRFLWKPESENDGRLVVLFKGSGVASIYGPDGAFIETGRQSTSSATSNWGSGTDATRFSKPGASYPAGSYVEVSGSRCYIPTPGSRVEKCYAGPAQETQTGKESNSESVITGDAILTGYATCSLGAGGIGDWICSEDDSIKSSSREACNAACASVVKPGSANSSSLSFAIANTNAPVGSRSFSQYCLNGEIVTEPCDDFRFGLCSDGKCELNPWSECLAINEEENKSSGTYNSFVSAQNQEEEDSCDPMFCSKLELEANCIQTINILTGKLSISCDQSSSIVEESENKVINPLYLGLGLDMCLPKVPGGLQFYPSQSDNKQIESVSQITSSISTAEQTCALGNLETNVVFWHCRGGAYHGWKCVQGCGLVEGSESWVYYSDVCEDSGGFDLPDSIQLLAEKAYSQNIPVNIPLSESILELLNERCTAIADCDGKPNWIGISGGESSAPEEIFGKKSANHIFPSGRQSWETTFAFSYECKLWNSPSGGDCEQCGADGLSCSEYRCKAIAKNCNYYEPEGSDNGYCQSSGDKNPPQISCVNCPSTVDPFNSVGLEIKTNENAECKFNIGSSGATFEEMQYSFDSRFGTEHKTTLFIPGQEKLGLSDESSDSDEEISYGSITRSGNYELFVRCSDVSGNFNSAPFTINFEVLPAPDKISPVILGFNPSSGLYVEHNISVKAVKLNLNEPSECKWDLSDKSIEEMQNGMFCDSAESSSGFVSGYSCQAVLTNVSQEAGSQTNYYIRCKDPAGNEMSSSKLYSLRMSGHLTITDYIPKDKLSVNINNISTSLKVQTSGGSESGKSICKFQINEQGQFVDMLKTNSNSHEQPLRNISQGVYKVAVNCKDGAGNKVEQFWQFGIEADLQGPKITRIYDQGGLVVVTNEPSTCFVSYEKCNFDITNDTIQMSDSGLKHSSQFNGELLHYIKCVDGFGNAPSRCALTVRGNAL